MHTWSTSHRVHRHKTAKTVTYAHSRLAGVTSIDAHTQRNTPAACDDDGVAATSDTVADVATATLAVETGIAGADVCPECFFAGKPATENNAHKS